MSAEALAAARQRLRELTSEVECLTTADRSGQSPLNKLRKNIRKLTMPHVQDEVREPAVELLARFDERVISLGVDPWWLKEE